LTYKLIIADDEEIERKAFGLMIYEFLPNVTVVDEAATGYDLIHKVDLYHPDIIIVDIDMPGMNGLESIRLLKQKGVDSKIIIHTAYSKFEYAQEALELGADDYILKPIKKEKIIKTIKDCIAKIDIDQKKARDDIHFAKKIESISPIVENDFMSSIIIGDSDKTNLEIYLDILEIRFVSGFIMTLSLPEKVKLDNDKTENDDLKEVLTFIKNELMNICCCIISPLVNNKIFLFVHVDHDISLCGFKIWSLELARLIYDKVKNKYDIKIVIGIGGLYNNLEHLSRSHHESLSVIIDQLTKSNIKHYADLIEEARKSNPFTEYENEIFKYVNDKDIENSFAVINNVFKEIAGINNINIVKDMIFEFILSLNKMTCGNCLQPHRFININNEFDIIIKSDSIEELKHYVETIVENTISILIGNKKTALNDYVQRAIEIVENNYQDAISLEYISDKIGVSSYYLSRLFKQELNMNYIDYLTEIRIKKALKLIEEKRYSIKTLSEKVGYNNPTYFCRVFKKATGKTIGEMRNIKEST